MTQDDHSFFRGRVAVLVTMHGKEHMIAAPLHEQLGLMVEAVTAINTDQFGTFTGEIRRPDTQYQTAIQKARAGMTKMRCDLGLASEGSFGPHPQMPWLAVNRELIVLVDQRNDWVLEGWAMSMDTAAAQQTVTSLDEALQFAQRVGFPAQGLVVRPHADSTRQITKGIQSEARLHKVVTTLLQKEPILIETDLRAHMNPKRQAVIAQAAEDLALNAQRPCPLCGAPGVRPVESVSGLPCEWCGSPTRLRKAEILACVRCEHREEKPYPDGRESAPPQHCACCNP